jgi:hypothetical protein
MVLYVLLVGNGNYTASLAGFLSLCPHCLQQGSHSGSRLLEPTFGVDEKPSYLFFTGIHTYWAQYKIYIDWTMYMSRDYANQPMVDVQQARWLGKIS